MLSNGSQTILHAVTLAGKLIGQFLRHDVVVDEVVEEEARDAPSGHESVEEKKKCFEFGNTCQVNGGNTSMIATLQKLTILVNVESC